MRLLRFVRWIAITLAINVALNFVVSQVLGLPILALVL